MTIEVVFNGNPLTVAASLTLQQLLEQQGYLAQSSASAATVVVAKNHTIVPLTETSSTTLQERDQIDVLGAITGG